MTTPACIKKAAQIRQSQWKRDIKQVGRYLKAMCSPCWSVRSTAEDAFILMPREKTKLILRGNLKKAAVPANACLRSSSLTALARVLGYDKSISPAIAYLTDPDVNVRRAAVKVLRNIPWFGMPRGAVLPLIKALGDSDSKVRGDAAYTLGLIKDQRALIPVRKLLADRDPKVIVQAIRSLSLLNDKRTRPIVHITTHADPDIRREAVVMLGYSLDKTSIPAITKRLDDANPKVRFEAVIALQRIGLRSVIPSIKAKKSDPDPEVRKAVAGALHFFHATDPKRPREWYGGK